MTGGAGGERPAVLVNLLWCVPGKVGGSEEYLVRQLLGLTEPGTAAGGDAAAAGWAAGWRPTVAMARGLAAAHPELAERLVRLDVLKDARGWDKPSDHVPVTATLDIG